MINPKIIVYSALIDTEEKLMRIDRVLPGVQFIQLIFTANQPARRTVNRILHIDSVRNAGRAFVKSHGDRRTEVGLDGDALLRAHKNFVAVDMRAESYALLADLANIGE